MNEEQESFSERVDAIESAYEFMLAYAAQGRDTDEGSSSGPPIRSVLATLSASLDGVSDSVIDIEQGSAVREFAATLDADVLHARRAVELVLSRPKISSQIIDNLNATIHLRSVLTNLFLIDEALKSR